MIHLSSINVEAITPSHLLHGRRLEPFPSLNVEEYCTDPTIDDRAQYLRDSYHNRNKVLQRWEKHWAEDYLVSLREKFYGAQTPDNVNTLKENDVVLLQTDQGRADLPLARILKLYPDENGIVRIAEVMVKGQRTLRTINKLIPLECSLEPLQNPNAGLLSAGLPLGSINSPVISSPITGPVPRGLTSNDGGSAAAPGPQRPGRLAAQRSRDHWLNLISGGHVT